MNSREAFDSIVGTEAAFGAAGHELTHGSALRGVMSQLRAGGMSVVEIIKLIPVIVDLIQQYGPVIAEIVAKIRETFAKK